MAACPVSKAGAGGVCPFAAGERTRPYDPAPVLDTGDIQADVVMGVNMKQHLLVSYLDIVDVAKAKAWLRGEILPKVTTADTMRAFRERYREARRAQSFDGAKPILADSATLNLSFSFLALAEMDAPDIDQFKGPNGFGTPFSIGLEQRAGILGDLEAACPPSGWVTGPRTPHILLQAGADSLAEYEALCLAYAPSTPEAAANMEARYGVRFLLADHAHRLDDNGSEQFGFHDAVSNPALKGYFSDGATPLSPQTVVADRYHALPGQDVLYPGEFILLRDRLTDSVWTEGLAGEGGARLPSQDTWTSKYASHLPSWAANGAFLVNRRLRQDVAGFWGWCEAEAAKSAARKVAPSEASEVAGGFSADVLAAKIFGRWPSGCPLARSATADIPALGSDKTANNAYSFACPLDIPTASTDPYPKAASVDTLGLVCPLSAHTRKMNPRDGLNDVSTPIKRRLMRRGLPYGPRMADPRSGIDDGIDRGLQFIAYCSNIEEQFEFLQRKWANQPHGPTDGAAMSDIDPVIGQVAPGASKPFHFVGLDGQAHVVDAKGAARGGASQFVTQTGGGYFFSPSISALIMLSASSPSLSSALSAPRLPAPEMPNPTAATAASAGATAAFTYNFPGALTDLPASAKAAWSDAVHGFFVKTIQRLHDHYGIDDPLYFTKIDAPDAVQIGTHRVAWDGFAHKFIVRNASDAEVFAAADTLSRDGEENEAEAHNASSAATTTTSDAPERTSPATPLAKPICRQMDEYCEWHATRDAATGKIVEVDVTSEFPEYFSYMHSVAPDTVLQLYRQHVSAAVQAADLVDSDGVYDKYNHWNTHDGMMHLQQPADTAAAAVSISGSSTVQLVDALGRRISGKQKLMEAHGASPGGASPQRGSDPSITQNIYELTAPGQGAKLTLQDPIGVYMDEVNVAGWAAPDGTPLVREKVVTLVRGQPGAALRYKLRAPAGAAFVLGDCTVGGQRVQYGGQLVKNAITCYVTYGTYRAPITPLPVKLPPPPPALAHDGVEMAPTAMAAAVGVPLEAEEVPMESEALLKGSGGGGEGSDVAPSRVKRWLLWLFGC